MTWHDVREIRVREHTSNRPGSRPTLMVIYVLEDHADCFDHLAFSSDKQFAKDKAGSRWLELHGGEPVPSNTAEAIEREGELCAPQSIMITQDGSWERVSKVRFAGDAEAEAAAAAQVAASLSDDREFLQETSGPKSSQFDFSRWRS